MHCGCHDCEPTPCMHELGQGKVQVQLKLNSSIEESHIYKSSGKVAVSLLA